ncbi:MAG: pseudouridine synthase [Polyangiales bacterium]
MSSQRLQKILAQAGVASRRAAERLITEGRVRVNGRIVRELGSRANPVRDRVEVDGKRLVAERHVYFLMHKPRGVVTTLDDPEGRKTIKDLLRDVDQRVFPVGRLDFQTSGVLLLTNDGALTQALLHPTRAVPKTYLAKVQGAVEAPRLQLLREGVTLDDGDKTAPADVKVLRSDGKATTLEITISEGKNRQIHRMVEAIGRTVVRLTRISFAGLTLDSLRPGQLRPLHPLELGDVKEKFVHGPKRRRPGYPEPRAEEAVDDGVDELAASEAPASPQRGEHVLQRRDPRVRRDNERAIRGRGAVDGARGRRTTADPARGGRTTVENTRGRRTTAEPARGGRTTVESTRGRRTFAEPARGGRTTAKKGRAIRAAAPSPRRGPPSKKKRAVRATKG